MDEVFLLNEAPDIHRQVHFSLPQGVGRLSVQLRRHYIHTFLSAPGGRKEVLFQSSGILATFW